MAVAGEIARLIVDLQLQDHGFAGKVNSIGQALGRMDTGLSRMGRGVGQVGSGLARLGTVAAAAAAGGLTAVVTTAASMEEAFIGVQKTVEETASFTFEQLRDVLRTMSVESGTAFEELSRIGEIGGALGVGIESLDEFIDVVNRLGVSTDLSVDDAATALGHLSTVLQLTGEDYEDLADGLVALGNAGASSEAQIVAIAERFAVAGKRAGLSTAEILALGSAVASMGIEVEAGGTALSNTFNQIAVAIGTGGKEVKAFTDLLGISAAEFRRRWETDALGTFQEFLREVDKLPAIEQAVALEMAGITGVRQQAAVGALADGYAELGRQLAVVEDRQGALKVESDKFFASTATGFRRVREGLRLSAEAIGTELLPVANELITDFVKFLVDPTTQKSLKEFGTALAEGIRGFVAELKGTDFSGLLSGMKFAADAAKVAFDAFRSLPAPLQAAIVGLVALNKVSGGGISLLVKGIGNLALGGGGALGGLLGRGSSPATAVWVQSVTGPLGGPNVIGGGKWGFIGNALKVTVIGAVAIEGFNLAAEIAGLTDPRHVGPGGRGFRATNVPSEQIAIFEALLPGLRERAAGGDTFAAKQLAAIEAQLVILRRIEANTKPPVRPAIDTAAKLREAGLLSSKPTLPNTAFDAGGGVVNLPDTALAPLKAPLDATAANTSKLPPIVSNQERAAKLVAQRVNESRAAVGRGFTELGGIARSTASQTTMELRNTTSASRATAQRVAEQRAATDRGFANQAGYLNTISRKNFSPTVNVSARISNVVTVNANRVLERITEARVRTGTIPEFA